MGVGNGLEFLSTGMFFVQVGMELHGEFPKDFFDFVLAGHL